MFTNLWAFIKGAIGGLVGCIAFVIFGSLAGMDFSNSQWLLYWFFCAAFMGGFITSASETGFGILSFILFIVGLIGMHFFAIMSLISLYEAGEFFTSSSIAALGISGVLFLRWYRMIGEGDADGPWLFTFLTILIGNIAGLILIPMIGETPVLVISAVVDGICLILMLYLRMKNGSALDY